MERPSVGGDTSESTREKRADTLRCANLFYCSLGHVAYNHLASKRIHFLLHTLIIFFKPTLVHSVNVKHERLVNGEATGDVLVLAFNVSHLPRGGNLHCDITE